MKTYKNPITETVVLEAEAICDSQIFNTSGANGGQQIGETSAPQRAF